MYLKQLYKQHKGWFLFVLLFAMSQLFINYKRGVVFSPFYHYGMYSEKMEIPDTINLYEIEINGKTLQPFHFSAQYWDKLTLPLNLYPIMESHNNNFYENDIERLLTKIQIHPNPSNFTTQSKPKEFMDWYKKYAESITGINIQSLKIYYTYYILKDNKFQKIKQEPLFK